MTASQRIAETVIWLKEEIAVRKESAGKLKGQSLLCYHLTGERQAYEACLAKLEKPLHRATYLSAAQVETFIMDHLDKCTNATVTQIHKAVGVHPSSIYRALYVLRGRKQVTNDGKLWRVAR